MIGVPMAPKATGAVLASRTTAAARSGEAQGHEHDAGDGDRGAEAGEGLKEAAEAEGDDDRLDPWVVGDEVEGGPEVLEPAADHGDLVEDDRGEDDPHDGEEAEDGAFGGREHGEARRHPIDENGHEDGDGHGGEPGHVRLPPQPPQGDEDGQQRNEGDEGGADEASPQRCEVGLIGIRGDGEGGDHAGDLL
jgi:hypothetical protein